MKRKLKKRVEGVISVMLACLMLPFISVAGVVVETSRYYSAASLLSQVMDSASYSTLANYDQYLLNRFGLLAVDQKKDLQSTYMDYLTGHTNLISENGFASNDVVSNTTAQGIYPLSDPDILYYQIGEMDKLLSPITLARNLTNIEDMIDMLEKSFHVTAFFKILDGAADSVSGFADATSDVEDLKDICKALATFRDETCPNALTTFQQKMTAYKEALEAQDTAQETADAAQTALDDANDALDQANEELTQAKEDVKDVEGLEETVDDALTLKEKEDAVSDASDAKDEASDALDDANDALEEAKSACETAKQEAEAARNAYAKTLDDYADKLQSYKEKIGDYKEHKADATAKLANTVVSAGSFTMEVSKQELANQKKDLEKQKESLETQKESLETQKESLENSDDKATQSKKIEELNENIKKVNEDLAALDQKKVTNTKDTDANSVASTVASSVKDGIDGGVDAYDDALQDGLNEDQSENIRALHALADKVEEIDLDAETLPEIDDSYKPVTPKFANADNVKTALKETEDHVMPSDLLDMIVALLDIFDAILDVQGVVNPKLDAVLDTSMGLYGVKKDGLVPISPTATLREATVNEGDRARAQAVNKEVEGAVTETGLLRDAGEDALEKLFTDIEKAVETAREIKEQATLGKKLKKAAEFLRQVKTVGDDLTSLRIQDVVQIIKDGFDNSNDLQAYNVYLMEMLPNRTNFDSGTSMNGYHYNEIEFKQSNEHTSTSLTLASLFGGGIIPYITGNYTRDKMFCGAEMEYVLCGNTSEYMNQLGAVKIIYVERLLLDFLSIFTNKEAMTLMEVPVAGVVYIIITIFLEPLLDVLLLVNGNDVGAYKATVYCTPTGIVTWVTTLVNLANVMSKATRTKIEDKAEKIMTNGKTVLSDDVKNNTWGEKNIGSTEISTGIKLGKIVETLTGYNYQEHLFLALMLRTSVNRDKYTRRLADIIQMECNSKNQAESRTDVFEIGNAYTFVRSESTATLNQMLPLPTLADKNSLLKMTVLQYRGY